jgi:hypothetical protein
MDTNTFPEYATETIAFVLFMEYTERSNNGSACPVESFTVQVRVTAGNEIYNFDSPYTRIHTQITIAH